MSDDDESLLTYLAGMDARIDRLEGQLQQALSALATLTEISLLTYAATGTKSTIPAEVFDDPIAAQAIRRNPAVIGAIRDRPEPPSVVALRSHADLAALFLHGTTDQIAAEPRLAGASHAQKAMEANIDALFKDDPACIPAAYAESRQMIADTLARGQNVFVKQPLELIPFDDRAPGSGHGPER